MAKHNQSNAAEQFSEEQLARELAKVQQQVTGLGDSTDQLIDALPDGDPIDPALESRNSSIETDASLGQQLESAKKVMELLARMKPAANKPANLEETRTDPQTHRSNHEPSPGDPNHADSIADMAVGDLPTKMGRFQIERLLGHGGFGLVFLANDPELDRKVALKVPSFHALLNAESRARFQREGRAVAALSHPNIVPVFEVGNEGSISFIASEFISGSDLAKWVAKNGSLKPDVAAKATAVIADAIQHAHQRGVVHRDLKPGNILLESTDQESEFHPESLRVADFGLAKLLSENDNEINTRTGSAIGTPAFAAPEQIQSQPGELSAESADIYSLGALLYFLMTGQPPFQATSLPELVSQVVTQPPVPPEKHIPAIPKDLSAICLKCLAKDSRHRYSSAHELMVDLERFQNGEVTVARPATQLTRAIRWVKRNPIPTALLAVVATSALVVSFLLVRSENLRQLSETRQQKVVQTSRLLQQAVDKLFLTVADTPELKLQAFESFRQQLLGEARSLMSQFVAEKPDDMELFLLFTDTQLSFIKLCDALDDDALARETSAELIVDIEEMVESTDVDNSALNHLLITLTEVELIQWKYEDTEQSAARQADLLVRVNVELAQFDNDETRIFRAAALSRIAAQSVFIKDYTTAKKIQVQAMNLWDRIPDEMLAESNNLEQFAKFYSNSLRVVAGAENNEAAIRIAERAIDILEPRLDGQLSPESRFHLANIYRLYGYAIQGADRAEGIRLVEAGHSIALDLVADHPAIPSYQAFICVSNYSRALIPLIGKDSETAERILLENVDLANSLMLKFPGKALTLANSLTSLGLIYRGRRQWQQQLDTLQQSLVLVRENINSTKSDFHRIHASSVESEIGMCHVRLGEMETGIQLLEESARKLEAFCAADPDNGQAHRYRDLTIDQTAEALRRAGEPKRAMKYFDRLMEINPGEMQPRFMTDHIDQIVGMGDFQKVNEKLDEYSPILLQQPAAIAHAEVLAKAIVSLDASGVDSGISTEATRIRKRLVALACELLGQHLAKSDDRSRSMKTVTERKELAILRDEEEFVHMVQANQDRND